MSVYSDAWDEVTKIPIRNLAERVDAEILDLEKESPEPPPETRVALPEGWDRRKVEQLVREDVIDAKALYGAFVWSSTAQGRPYWSDIYVEASINEIELSDQARRYLKQWLQLPYSLVEGGHCEDMSGVITNADGTKEWGGPKEGPSYEMFMEGWAAAEAAQKKVEPVELVLDQPIDHRTGEVSREPQPGDDTPPDNWWQNHHPHCGTQYRGCHPTACPSDHFDRTGKWVPDLAYDSSRYAVAGGTENRSAASPYNFTATVVEPAPVSLADHLAGQPAKYLRALLVEVDYDYGDAVLQFMADNLRLDVDEVTKNLRKHMLTLRESLIDEVASWFVGRGRALGTGYPDIVECYLSYDNNVWRLSERETDSGKLGVSEEICSRLAYHLMLMSNELGIEQDEKVTCLMNLILRR